MLICLKGQRGKETGGFIKMLRLRHSLILSIILLVSCITTNGIAAQAGTDWLVSPELLEQAKIKILWQQELPIRNGEHLEQLIIAGSRIYALSDRNFLVSMDRDKGGVIFSKSIASTGIPVVGFELYQDELISVIGNKLTEFNPETGTEIKTKVLNFGVVCPVVRNSEFFYVSWPDKRLHTLQADNHIQVFEVSADKNSLITSVIATETFVIFGTKMGNVISITPDKPKRLWQFDAADAIAGPIVLDGRQLFFASKDTYLYRVDITGTTTAELIWKYQIPSIPNEAPRVTRRVVYQYAPTKGLAAIDRQTGLLMWLLPQGAELLAEADRKAFVVTNAGTLAVMDNARGKLLYTVNFADVSKYAANTTDSKIYIADERGRVACLEPVK
jgi:outer membrane protein assembly factor BamB